ncbi:MULTISPECIES: hypothetical protein [Chryseobacterium]|uniref:Nucleoside-diphosphate-sugar epimerase n=1 Tax=Chryseobacterium camelliae TaxID=1265445 RepID=A0ABU0TNA2_9FLAO|nr:MULTISPECIES: hypothetical protein [Chryseobacterium]MDT3407617.1 nucleoside-diphosphate-sugar epimerase [Pseudacidovorax intermedius]MDQ1098531.1 nucleoside-diphosphate-sugar epimerase [Chryseobacterium camelliae]MDQ1102455.1 nucleoside-diphosphate-sugar epimerase [Chryseobacterium sp. SORGH_AS_1048]MDR6085888.1 nucleoside-diphosphate-sugar epimerase [Chryseobacterium sp. SORGH_AS_0909]MDR6130255.1 nucleoside-diphosphate-sugar epimerase [Chryseobacterium sp. SORGH_AS_1175]
MIIGNGLIANSLQHIDTEDHLFFASGVSNSLETRCSEFDREFSLLRNSLESNPGSKLFYFSTLSIHDQSKQDSQYILHKLNLEDYIRKNAARYVILRIGNIVGKGGNPNTLFNFLKNQIKTSTKFNLHSKARRLLLDIDDIPWFISSRCSDIHNETINFAYPYYYDLKEIVHVIQEHIRTEADYAESDEGDFYRVDFTETVTAFFTETSPEKYLKMLAEKYI